MTTSTDLQNPYASPRGGSENDVDQPSTRLPKFVKVVLILDLVACVYRLVNGAACLVGVTVARSFLFDKPELARLFPFLVAETGIGLFIGVLGTTADILGLRHRPVAFRLGIGSAAASLAFLSVVLWKLALRWPDFPSDRARIGGFAILGALAAVRLSMIGVFVLALVRFKRWTERSAR